MQRPGADTPPGPVVRGEELETRQDPEPREVTFPQNQNLLVPSHQTLFLTPVQQEAKAWV